MKNVKPPEIYTVGDTRIGQTKGRGGGIMPVTLPDEVRDRHVYVVGKSGTGKSTLIENIARKDIEAGHGLAVIDPRGDLVQHLLETLPEHRVADCVLLSPKHFPVSLEILTAENEHEMDLLREQSPLPCSGLRQVTWFSSGKRLSESRERKNRYRYFWKSQSLFLRRSGQRRRMTTSDLIFNHSID